MSSRPSSRLLRDRLLSSSSKHSVLKAQLISILAFTIAALAAIILAFFYTVCHYRRRRSSVAGRDEPPRIRRYEYRQLKRATKSFSPNRKLGKGGFGVVYKGLLRNGKQVAVKKLDLLSLQGEREFKNELSICNGLNSPHIVNLLGYCTHGKKLRLLVYECMENRSLQEALFDQTYSERLDWNKRFKIIGDTAKGLEFLHVGCNPPIIHGDVKPSNILLDRNFSAHIGDFGLARFKSETLGSESARFSASSEKVKHLETPERLRLSPPDYASPGTPHMSRSSTSRNPFSEFSCKGTDSDYPRKLLAVNNRPCKIDDAAAFIEALPRSSSLKHFTGQAYSLVDEYGTSIKATDEKNYDHKPQKGMFHQLFDDQAANDHFPVEFSQVALQERAKGLTQSSTVVELSSTNIGEADASSEKENEMGNLAGKKYVLDWLGSEHNANHRPSCDRTRDETVSPTLKLSKLQGNRSRLGGVEAYAGGIKKEKRKAKTIGKKGIEWWKDEYFDELSAKCDSAAVLAEKKRNKTNSFENWKNYLSADATNLSEELQADNGCAKGSGKSKSKEWFRSARSGELGNLGATERQRVPSIISDLFNEERRCHLSLEVVNGQWSGELSKSGELVSRDASSTTSMRGTVCYVAPEFGGSGMLSEKSDIYSFGVLMLVVLSGRRPIQVSAAPMKEFERANLILWARKLSQNGKLLDLIDEGLHGEYDREEAILCITLALLCLQRGPSTRPDISEIVKMLSREMAVPNLPLELSSSPPARIPYKIMRRSPKSSHAQNDSESATPSNEGAAVL